MFALPSIALLFSLANGISVRRAPTYSQAHADFAAVFDRYNKSFDYKVFSSFLDLAHKSEVERLGRAGAKGGPLDRPHCNKGQISLALPARPSALHSKVPGDLPGSLFGSFFQKVIDEIEKNVNPSNAEDMVLKALLLQATDTALGFVQTVVATAITVIPPQVPPPVWNNMPFPCLPMVTGHNCFGAILYPITAADFAIADVTDAAMDGLLEGFPTTYRKKVGKTSDDAYTLCGMTYFTMHCSALFPKCDHPQAFEEFMPRIGRVPMCMHMCVLPLVTCPGFWVDDIIGPCSMVSVPPMCAQAFFWMKWKIPPQLAGSDDVHGFEKECPEAIEGDGAADAALFDSTGLGATRPTAALAGGSGSAAAAAKGKPIAFGA